MNNCYECQYAELRKLYLPKEETAVVRCVCKYYCIVISEDIINKTKNKNCKL